MSGPNEAESTGSTARDPLESARAALARHDWAAALALGDAAETDDASSAAERLDLIADAAWWLGRFDDCIAAREQAYLQFDALGDAERAGAAAVRLFEDNALSARPAIAAAWLRRARRSLDSEPSCAAYGALLLREAEVAHGTGDLDEAESIATRVVARGRDLRSPDLEAEALQTRGRVRIERGDVAEGMGDLDEAMLFAVEGRLGPYATGKVYCSLVSACEELGDLDRAAEWTDATMRWASDHPFAIFPGICRVHRAHVLERRGSLQAARAEAERACTELRGNHVANLAVAYAEVGDIRRRLGDLALAEEAFAFARELTGRECAGLALVRLAQGRGDVARSIVDQCLADATHALARVRLLPTLVIVAAASGDLDAAATAVDELESIARVFSTTMVRATASSARGRLELVSGRAAEAAVTLRRAVEQWRALQVPYEVATALTMLGQAQRDSGNSVEGRNSFAAAASLFAEIGATIDVPAHSDVGDARRRRPAGLSDREAEVLALVARGLTNQGIADALCISTKTVSRHLSNIFTKVGVTTRAAATAFAFEQGLTASSAGGDPATP